MAMKGFLGGLQTTPIASVASGYGLEVLGPHVRRQEVDKRCLENVFLRYLALVVARLAAILQPMINVFLGAHSGGGTCDATVSTPLANVQCARRSSKPRFSVNA